MWDGLGFGLISNPFLEKITRDESLGREHPRKRSETPSDRKKPTGSPGDPVPAAETDDHLSSTHIDLRI
jgi:hypothetical protein